MAILMLCECGGETRVEGEGRCGGVRCLGCGRELRLPDRDGPTLPRRRRFGRAPTILASALVAVAVLGLAIKGGAEGLERSRKDRCRKQISTVALAVLTWAEEHGHFPDAAIRDTAGKPLLSWRVAILPALGQRSLYEQFHLDEPWDSPHNKALIGRMPAVYACPSGPGGAGMTGYLAIVGAQAMFEPDHEVTIEEVTDGTANTILLVESPGAVPWTRPEDLVYEPEDINAATVAPLPVFGSGHPGGYHGAFADGSVRFIRETVDDAVRRNIITRDGGEVLTA